jgi:large subunit ribosomal protein L24
MKSSFSNSWKRSKQPRKQRKYLHNAPMAVRHKLFSAPLSKELRQKYRTRNIPVRKGDVVRISSGKFKGQEGKVEKIITKSIRVFVAGAQVLRSDGRKSYYPIHPSKLVIKELELGDKKRKAILERRGKDKKPVQPQAHQQAVKQPAVQAQQKEQQKAQQKQQPPHQVPQQKSSKPKAGGRR